MNTEQDRADFEMWCHTRSLDIGRDVKGDYISLETYLSWEAYQAGRAALQSQATEAFPCRIIEGDFEAGTVTLEMQGKYTVSAGQKYLCNAPLQSQDREDAARLDWLQQSDGRFHKLLHITSIVGRGFSPTNSSDKWFSSLREAIDHARRVEGDGM